MDGIFNTDSTRTSRTIRSLRVGKTELCFIRIQFNSNLYSLLIRNHTNIIHRYVEIKCQLDATEVFIADLIACSTCFGDH